MVKGIVVVGAVMMIGVGLWCRLDPAGFAELANWPAHEHFLHDAGIFQIAIGLMMLSALWWQDVLTVVLVGFLFTNLFHALNHFLDQADGGHGWHAWFLLLVAVLAGVGLVARVRQTRPVGKEHVVTSTGG
jgi:protein-S-isoprenylcysteine O-methyltransferase Ste14